MLEHNDELLNEIGDLLATHYETWKECPQEGPEVAFGRYLAATRRQQKLSIAELAQKAGLPESEVLAYEHGLIPQTRIKAQPLQAMATALGEDLAIFLLILGVDIGAEPPPTTQHPDSPATGHRFAPDGNQATARLTPLPISPMPIGRLRLIGRAQSPTEATPTAPSRLFVHRRVQQIVTPLVVGLLLICVGAAHYRFAHPVPLPSPTVSVPISQSCSATAVGTNRLRCPGEQLTSVPAQSTNLEVAAEPAGVASSSAVISSITAKAQSTVVHKPVTTLSSPAALLETNRRTEPAAAPMIPVSLPTQPTASAQPVNPLPPPGEPVASLTEHKVDELENLWCIAQKYYDDGDLYPLICQFNFGDALCSQPLHPGDLLKIPVLADFTALPMPLDTQSLPIAPAKLERFKQIERETVSVNHHKQRGVDYWCEENDDEIYARRQVGSVAQISGAVLNVGLP